MNEYKAKVWNKRTQSHGIQDMKVYENSQNKIQKNCVNKVYKSVRDIIKTWAKESKSYCE